jgi:alanine racemase
MHQHFTHTMNTSTCWIEIDLSSIRHNFREIQKLIAPAQIIAVTKANAYGHGAAAVSLALEKESIRSFAVTKIEEARELRNAGVQKSILLLAPLLEEQADEAIQLNLTPCVTCEADAKVLSDAAARASRAVNVHLKIDTGMGRFGVDSRKAVDVAKQIAALPNLKIEGVYTHFANANSDGARPSALQQFHVFQTLIQPLQNQLGLTPEMFHCANSAATLRFPQTRLQCVRVGTLLYGQYPSAVAKNAAPDDFKLCETFCAKARIVAIKKIKTGQSVGYGSEWTAKKTSAIAIVAAGFADGLGMEPQTRVESISQLAKSTFKRGYQALRGNNTARSVIIHGQKAPIAGRIAMQTCAIDVSDIANVKVGDEVILPMRRLAASALLPRIYREEN